MKKMKDKQLYLFTTSSGVNFTIYKWLNSWCASHSHTTIYADTLRELKAKLQFYKKEV